MAQNLKSVRQRRYLAKDFDAYQAQLLEYAKTYYPDKIKDFSENSLGGLLLDFASSVGDSLSFYLDHQYSELSHETAVETKNIERLIRDANVKITGTAPSNVEQTFYVLVPAKVVNNAATIDDTTLPIIRAGTIVTASNGTEFILTEDIDYTEVDDEGNYTANVKVAQRSQTNVPTSYVLTKSGTCISGKETTDTITIGSFIAFRKITLNNQNVNEIISVVDDLGNTYYEVGSLTHDVVYRNVANNATDSDVVENVLKIIPAPYRFTTSVDIASRSTTMTFGGGSASTFEDDVIPDPTDFAVRLPTSRNFGRATINPSSLLTTKTLGVASSDTTLSIRYRYGGGLSHNVPENTIKNVKTLLLDFPNSPKQNIAAQVRGSIETNNIVAAQDGDDAPTIDDLKQQIPSARAAQDRIAGSEDLLARVYSMPTNFGRVFRASCRRNTNNPLSTDLYIVTRSTNGILVNASDTLKKNLTRYLSSNVLLGDSIDILDAKIINLKLTFDIVVDVSMNKQLVLQAVLSKLQTHFNVKNSNIDQPIVFNELSTKISSVNGVVSVVNITFENVSGTVNNRKYSDVIFDPNSNVSKGLLIPSKGGIFEVRYVANDITGRAL